MCTRSRTYLLRGLLSDLVQGRSRVSVALVGGEPKEARSLTVVHGEAAATVSVENAKILLPIGVVLVGGQLEEARGFALVLGETTAAVPVENTEISLPGSVALVGGQLKQPRSLAVVLGKAAPAVSKETAELVLTVGVALIGGEFEEAQSLVVVLGKATVTGFVEISFFYSRGGLRVLRCFPKRRCSGSMDVGSAKRWAE